MKKMSEEHKAAVKEFYEQQSDWWAQCPKCGAKLRGTAKALLEHRCHNG